jgi:phage tail P2-like protein
MTDVGQSVGDPSNGATIIANPGSSLLYRQAAGLEQAMADTDATRLMALDAEIVLATWSPEDCPIALLPYLAWAMGVNFWNDNWSETTKRSWIAVQWQFKALRGSAAGIEMAIDYAGRDVSPFGYSVRDIVTRPQQLFPGPSISAAAREAWLAELPQVRVYYFTETGTAVADKFFINFSWLGVSNGLTTRMQVAGEPILGDPILLQPHLKFNGTLEMANFPIIGKPVMVRL